MPPRPYGGFPPPPGYGAPGRPGYAAPGYGGFGEAPALPPQQQAQIHPAQLRRMLEEQQALRGEVSELRKALEGAGQRALQKPRYIEDIPGPRFPYTYRVDVDFVAAATAPQSGSVSIAADGPFVCTEIRAFWRVTADGGTNESEWQGVSRYPYRVQGTTVPASVGEFSFKITTGGSGRFWQSDWLAGPMLDAGLAARPWYQGIAGWIERANTLIVEVNPDVAIPTSSDGTVHIYFHGYHIIIPQNLSEAFGWSV